MTKSSLMAALLLFTCAASLAGCKGGASSQLKTIDVQLGGRLFNLEVADNDDTRRTGLMYRQEMPENHGMLFVFEYSQVLGFWMKNTNIPLDILYLDKTGTIVAIRQMKPHDTNPVSSVKPARYAIELNAGTAGKVGVKEGDKVVLPGYTDQP